MSLLGDDLVDARCPVGHVMRWGGTPFRVERGTVPRLYGRPIHCGRCDRPLGVQH